jgi:hypothetical protein
LFVHCIRLAASLADCTAGSNKATRMPMIVITTNSSTSVNADLPGSLSDIATPCLSGEHFLELSLRPAIETQHTPLPAATWKSGATPVNHPHRESHPTGRGDGNTEPIGTLRRNRMAGSFTASANNDLGM